MEVLYERCAGLDVHKESVVVCVRRTAEGGKVESEVRSFSTMTRQLLAMSDWLAERGVKHVAMEATGVYWKPIWNLLEERFDLLLANARHMRNVPGRKTDVKDCEWIAKLLQHGLLERSFVPERPQRELRDLTRHRVTLIEEKTRVVNRIQKVLEDANIKLGSVASDVMGVSGREMLRALIRGEDDPGKVANLAKRRLRNKLPELTQALEGRVRVHHRFMLGQLMEQVESIERLIAQVEERIEAETRPNLEAVERLTTIPGVDQRAAQNILAEIGTDMSRFKTSAHLASWAGICPGNNESAGKHKSARINHGNRWLKRTLTQSAWAASHTKGTFLQAKFRRLAARRGNKRALVAIAHSVLQIAYHLLKEGTTYQDLGATYHDERNKARITRSLVNRLEALGNEVSLSPKLPA